MTSFRIRGATVLTMNDAFDVVEGEVAVVDGRIAAIGEPDGAFARLPVVDAGGDYLLPGFVQAHIHLCQTLFRHQAEGRRLLSWLRDRIWPLEGALVPETLSVAAECGVAELLLSGTTCLLDMGTVHHQDAVMSVLDRSGIRAAAGKAMMDAGDGVPASLAESTRGSIDESVRLARAWHGHDGDRLRYALAPRFALSCTADLQREVARLSAEYGYLLHTHASEQEDEIRAVEARFGTRNIHHLDSLGLCSERSVFAHCVHVDDGERQTLARTGTAVCHCPSSNLKLGSGIADVPALRAAGITVAIAADGAPCNNSLDALREVRLAHLLQCGAAGPGALTARDALSLATNGGARALGWEDRIGSIEVGKDADLVRYRRGDFRSGVSDDPYEELVCAGARDLVRDVWVRGERLVADGALVRLDAGWLAAAGRDALRTTLERAGLA